MASAPTTIRPHRAPAASFTEGPQRVLRVQPIEHLPSSSHNLGMSSNHHKTTQSICCLLNYGGSTASLPCTAYRAPVIFSHSHGKSSIHHKTTQSTCCLLDGGSTASPSCTTYRAPAIFLTYSWHVFQPSQDHTEHLLPPSRWVNQQVLHAQPIKYLPSSSHSHGKSCNHNRTT